MRTVSVLPKKSQTISVNLSGQQCTIRLIQRISCIYMDFSVNGNIVAQGVPCLYGNKMIRYKYLGFSGDLVFLDNEGGDNPSWEGLGSRYPLYYIEESEIV